MKKIKKIGRLVLSISVIGSIAVYMFIEDELIPLIQEVYKEIKC